MRPAAPLQGSERVREGQNDQGSASQEAALLHRAQSGGLLVPIEEPRGQANTVRGDQNPRDQSAHPIEKIPDEVQRVPVQVVAVDAEGEGGGEGVVDVEGEVHAGELRVSEEAQGGNAHQ